MSVILKALRSQGDEGGAETPSSESGAANAFQIDTNAPAPGGGGPGSNKRTIILAVILAASIIFLVVSMLLRNRGGATDELPPVPKAAQPAPVAAPATPVPAVEPAPVVVPGGEAAAVPAAPAAPNADLQVARSQYKSGQYDDSIKSFQNALEKDPTNASIYNDMGLAFLKKELYTSAEGNFAKALELDAKCAECYNNLGYLKTLLDQPMEAEKYLQKSISLKPDYPDPYFNIAVLYEKSGEIAKAVESYQEFLKRIPKTDVELAAKIKARIHELSGE